MTKRSARIEPGPGRLPHFRSEEEELRFWDQHNPVDWIEGPGDLIIRPKRRPKKQITIRIDEPLYDELRAVADEHGVPYQRLMRELLRQSLSALRAQRKRAAGRRGLPRGEAKAPAAGRRSTSGLGK